MLTIIASVLYVIIAVAMTVLILLQRGAGAAAGSGFGGGASATVFGSQGSANFMSRSTAVLAGLFFLLSLGMAIYHDKPGIQQGSADDLGIMGGAAAPSVSEAPAPSGDVPQATPAATTIQTPAATAAPANVTVPVPEESAAASTPAAEPPNSDQARSDDAKSESANPEPAAEPAKDAQKK